MAQSTLTIDLNALRTNWRNLNSKTACETAAVVKADSYGLGAGKVSQMLAQIGVRKFFVAPGRGRRRPASGAGSRP